MQLTADQQNAYDAFFRFLSDNDDKVFVLSGYSGTGKSTLIKTILKDMTRRLQTIRLIKPNVKDWYVHLTATTNKAAENLAHITGKETKTIHSLLGLRVKTDFSKGTTQLIRAKNIDDVEGSLVFIDEASFIDDELLHYIMKNTKGCKIVFIGDPAQLLNVGCSTSPVFDAGWTEARLTQIVRQADGSPIQDLSNKFRDLVNTGEFFSFSPDGIAIQHIPNRSDFDKAVLNEFARSDWKSSDSKVLAWTNKRVINFNHVIRENVEGEPDLEVGDYAVVNRYVKSGKASLKTDQQVKITSKRPTTRLGIIGFQVTLDHKFAGFMPEDWNKVKEFQKQLREEDKHSELSSIANWLDLRAAYSCTINKSQGSTYGKVFIDLDDLKKCRDPDQLARLLYVGVSRAKDNVVLTGDLV